jgi:hypothetical protein
VLVQRISFTASQLMAIPQEERAFLILLAHALNEVNMLNKLFAVSTHFAHEPKWKAHIELAQSMMLGRLLIGKLHEAWVAITKGFLKSKAFRSYGVALSAPAQNALSELKTYFRKESLVNSVRNEYAFHFSLENASVHVPHDMPSDELSIYLHEAIGNSLYLFAETSMSVALLDGIKPADPEYAIGALLTDTTRTVDRLNTFGQDIIIQLLERHVGAEEMRQSMQALETGDCPTFESVTIPFFIEVRASTGAADT